MKAFKLTPVDIITSKQYKNQWLIKDVMESKSLGMLFGAPASAKSFIAMDIAFCIAAGIDWNGNKTKHGKVVYLAGEGSNGLATRFKALEHKYGTTVSDIYLSGMPASLSDPENTDIVFKEIQTVCSDPALIIIDTLHRNFGNADENSARDIAVFLHCVTALMNATKATVLIVHHSGHGSADRARGSSSIKAALDFEYKAVKKEDSVTMSCTKAKEFSEPAPMSFTLVTQPISGWFNDEGKPVESAILRSTTYVAPVRVPSLTQRDTMILEALKSATNDKGQMVPQPTVTTHPELAGKKFIHLDDWRSQAYTLLDSDMKQQTKQQTFIRSRKKLLAENRVQCDDDDNYWEVV
jgi:hypothetical protein